MTHRKFELLFLFAIKYKQEKISTKTDLVHMLDDRRSNSDRFTSVALTVDEIENEQFVFITWLLTFDTYYMLTSCWESTVMKVIS
jgi:hypothetical protein